MSQSPAYIRALVCCWHAEEHYASDSPEIAWSLVMEAVRLSVDEMPDIYEALDITTRTNKILLEGLSQCDR